MKLYDKIKNLLECNPSLRDSDKKLMWTVWMNEQKASLGYMDYDDFMTATSPESCRRARQLVVANHPELGPTSDKIKKVRRSKELSKGTFAYRENFDNQFSETLFNLEKL